MSAWCPWIRVPTALASDAVEISSFPLDLCVPPVSSAQGSGPVSKHSSAVLLPSLLRWTLHGLLPHAFPVCF